MTSRKLRCYLLMLAVLMLVATTSMVQAQTYTDLFDFDGAAHGCCQTYPGVMAQGRDGNLYGTTNSGGSFGEGAVIKLAPGTGAVTLLHSFNFTDGLGPRGGLSLGLDGNFYGTTYQGGAHSAGEVFQITPSGTLTVIYSFANGTDSAYPYTPPVPAPDGNLYGTTANSAGRTVYKITTAGVLTTLASLPAESDGALTVGVDGKLYGTTLYGGTFNAGTAFQITTKGVLKTIYSFDNTHGGNPQTSLFQASDGNFYGTASTGGTLGGGVVFKLTPAGVLTVLHNFDGTVGSIDGKGPTCGVVLGSDGFLYGSTNTGGTLGDGTLYKVKTNGTNYAVIYDFDKTTGANPTTQPFLLTTGIIYGMTSTGGSKNEGVLYSLNASLKAFTAPVVLSSGKAGASVGLLGQGFNTATGVLFGTGAGTFTITSDNYITAKVATNDTTGLITVQEPGGNLLSPQKFKVVPGIKSFSPPSGPVGTSVVITGTSFLQATTVKFGGVAATVFTVNSDTQITATVPTGAVTGKISVTTPGGTANSATSFTVN
jgi:uncharacterized repeat protein (TIGR03803 family)